MESINVHTSETGCRNPTFRISFWGMQHAFVAHLKSSVLYINVIFTINVQDQRRFGQSCINIEYCFQFVVCWMADEDVSVI